MLSGQSNTSFYLGVLDALAWAKNTLWVRPCLSVAISLGRRWTTWPGSLLRNSGKRGRIVGMYCRAAVTSDRIGATVAWRQYCATVRTEVTVGTQWPRITSEQQWPKDIARTRCYSTMTSDDSVTMTHEMWREEHLKNISVLERVNLSNLVLLAGCSSTIGFRCLLCKPCYSLSSLMLWRWRQYIASKRRKHVPLLLFGFTLFSPAGWGTGREKVE
jgi:hypothetical protein